MHILRDEALREGNTLRLPARARALVDLDDVEDLPEACEWARQTSLGIIPLGQGSNVVLAGDLDALVLRLKNRGIDLLVADCNASAACTEVSPQLLADLTAWRESVTASPRPIQIGGSTYEEDEELFLEALGAMLDWGAVRYRVPRAIHEAVEGDTDLWNHLLSLTFGVTITDAAGESWWTLSGTANRGLLSWRRTEMTRVSRS